MKHLLYSLFLILISVIVNAQIIPFGDSEDSIITLDGETRVINYYKPSNYDSTDSPMLLAIHGAGGPNVQIDLVNALKSIANRRNA